MAKVIYLSCMRLTDRVERTWFIKTLQNSGMDVEYWDITNLAFGDIHEPTEINRKYVVKIDSIRALNEELNKLDENRTIIFMLLHYEYRFIKIYTLVQRKIKICGYFLFGLMPINDGIREKYISRLIKLFNGNSIRKIYQKIIEKLLISSNIVRPFEFIYYSGDKDLIREKILNGKLIALNSPDYEIARDLVKNKNLAECEIIKRYAVFIDVNICYQSDIVTSGLSSINPEIYFGELNSFFGKIENQYDVEVVICSHPKAIYKNNPFGNRKILYNRTADMTKNCEFVISHHSTAIGFPILFGKPILFIYTSEMLNKHRYSTTSEIISCAKFLNLQALNISDNYTLPSCLNYDRTLYEKYKYKFLTTVETEELNNEEIVVDYINNVFKS
jgi:hypothetical protein